MLLAAQPIVSVAAGTACGFELLVRKKTASGILPDAGFLHALSITERQALDQAGIQALPSASHALTRMTGKPPAFISINLFAETLSDYVACAAAVIAAQRALRVISPVQLVVEFHESVDMPESTERAAIEAFQAVGIGVAQDDHSNSPACRRRHHLPWDWIKYSVGGMSLEDLSARIKEIRRIHGSHVRIVAEAPRSTEQIAGLWRSGVDYIQGFCTGAPTLLPDTEALGVTAFVPVTDFDPCPDST